MDGVDLALFQSCREALKQDEIISKDLDLKQMMMGLDVGNPRIDCHLIAHGIFTIDDAIKAGIPIPDENITDDEIRKVIGYLFDCQVARLDGFSFFQTILTCVYLNREYQIKNPKLRTLVYGFIPALRAIERLGRSVDNPNWCLNRQKSTENLLPDVDIDKLREELAELEKGPLSDAAKFVQFELELEKYLNSFFESPTDIEFIEPPQFSEKLGFVPEIHYRKLTYHTPPQKIEIKDHADAIKAFADFLNDMKRIQAFPEFVSVRKLLNDAFEWSWNRKSALLFARLMLVKKIFPDLSDSFLIHGKQLPDVFQRELTSFHCPPEAFANEKFEWIQKEIAALCYRCFYANVCFAPQAHAVNDSNILRAWGIAMQHVRLYENEAMKNVVVPKVTFNDWIQLLKSSMSFWCFGPSTDLIRHQIMLGIYNEVYNELDYAAIFAALSEVYACASSSMAKERIVEAVYAVNAKKKKSKSGKVLALRDIDIHKAIKEESVVELTMKAMSELMAGCFHYVRLLDKIGAMKLKPPLFYHRRAVYKSRISVFQDIQLVKLWDYDHFEASYDVSKASEEELKSLILSKFNAAKADLAKANKIEPNEKLVDLVRQIVMNSLVMNTWKPGAKVHITFDGDLPIFKIE